MKQVIRQSFIYLKKKTKLFTRVVFFTQKGRILFVLSLPLFFILSAFTASLFTVGLFSKKPSLLLVDRYHSFIGAIENKHGTFGYWPLPDTLPPKIPLLLKAAEDHRFENHPGVDLFSLGRAIVKNYITRKGFSGASTIAMQVARMQGAGTRRTSFLKMRESFTAVWLTLFYGREKVLRHYLTIAPYGNRIAGINYAARRYFKKPLADLSWAEVGLLTALPNAPGIMNLYREDGFRAARKRACHIINNAYQLGWITEEQKANALSELSDLELPSKELRQSNMLHPIIAIEKHLADNPKEVILDPHNPTLRTTLDIDMQDVVTDISIKHMENLRAQGAGNIAAMVIKRETGEIFAYSGSDYYFDDVNGGQIDYADKKRSTGSILKPFIYAYGMEWKGYTPATLLTDIGLYFGDGDKPFIPRNYDDRFLGPVLYKFALANSRNIPAVQVLRDVGLEHTYKRLANLGLTSDDGNSDYYGLGLAVGNLYCSLHQLCNAYLSLANEGKKVTTRWVYEKKDSSFIQTIDSDVALQIQRILSDPQARLPSFPRGSFLEYAYPVAVKTGTSRGYRDAWTIGWSDTWLVGVWIGRHDNQTMKELNGFAAAAPVVQEIFGYLHPERKGGLSNLSFAPPEGYKPFKVNTLTGELNNDRSPFSTTVYLKPGTEPTNYSRIEKWLAIDKRNNLLASPYCPDEHVVTKRFIALPGIFKDWAQLQNLTLPPQQYSPLCDGSPVIRDYEITITYPQNGARLFIDPEMPEEYNVLMLNCMVEPRVSDVVWLVNGREFAISSYPYRQKWDFSPGEHTFQAQIPYTGIKSEVVTIEVF